MNNEAIANNETKRLVPVIASIAIQICLGTAYIWSVFQTGISNYLFAGDNAAAAWAFSLLLALLTVGSTIGGKIQDKIGPSPVIIIGGIILALGFLLSALVKPTMPRMLWVTYGFLGGIGMGFIYSTTIACCQKWYPDKRGLISGIIVSALGFGGVLFTPVAQALIVKWGGGVEGIGELKTFAFLGLIFLIVCTIGGALIKNPPVGFKPAGWTPPAPKPGVYNQQFSPMEVLKTPQFYIITATLMFACMAGLMMINFARPLALEKGVTLQAATAGVMIISIFNSIGRLFWGWISDKLGRKNTILILLVSTAVLIPMVNLFERYAILVLIGMIGFAYGGFLGTFPAITADYFGAKNMGSNYGMVLLGFGIGAIAASQIAGHFRNVAAAGNDINLMLPAFIIASVAAVIGAIMMFVIKPPKLKREKVKI